MIFGLLTKTRNLCWVDIQQLREILMTIYERRNVVLRNSLTKEAITAFQSCMESLASKNEETNPNGSSQKEIIVRSLLANDWVNKFELSLLRKNDPISLLDGSADSILADENSFIRDMCQDSSEIEKSFQKSLNSSFEGTSVISLLFWWLFG